MAKLEVCGVQPGRKHRIHQWINTETLEPFFGIQANVEYGKWAHVANDHELMFFPTKEAASAKAKELSKAA